MALSNYCSAFALVNFFILFSINFEPLSTIIHLHSITHHSFAYNLLCQMSAPPCNVSKLLHSMQSFISDIKSWAATNMLKLNDNKTEFIIVTSKRTKLLHNLDSSMTIGYA